LTDVLRHLKQMGDLQGDLALPDALLLERFVRQRDEAAFTALVVRHGPMVLGVCRRLLRQETDVEDAFQASFLVLARKDGGIARRELLAGWLYGVALRVASRLRADIRRRDRQRRDLDLSEAAAAFGADVSDLPALLDEEVGRLPTRYRRPVVLCYLQGQSNEEAARQLSWPVGTVKGRLSRARDMLRTRLARRGVALSAAAVAEALAANKAAALSPALLAAGRAVLGPAAAASARAAALSTGVLRMMFLNRLKIAAAIVAVVLGAGATLFAFHATSKGPDKAPDPKPDAVARDRAPDRPKDADRDKARAVQDLLQGVWDVTAVETGGKDQGAPEKRTVWEFKGDRVFLTEDYSEESGTFSVDPVKDPRRLDILVKPFVGKKENLPCIYQLSKDTLKVCMGVEGDRPAALTTRAGEKNMLLTLKRRTPDKDRYAPEALRRRYGDKTIAILKGATKVEVFRVDPKDHVEPTKDDDKDKRFGGYAITLKGDDQGEKFAHKAAALLLDRDNFVLNAAKGCKFSPGVGLRFWKGKEYAELLLCYQCSELKVVAPDPMAQEVESPMVDFDKGRAAFVKLAKELFPKDEAIQGLKETTTPDD
jgi:RNA polymerase sigma factor (sigma-70 family)